MVIRMIKNIKGFIDDIFSIFSFIYDFLTNDEIARLRIFFTWLAITLIPSIFIYFTINTWQVHIPQLEATVGNSGNPFINMIIGTSILPVLFFITKGLRGYHILFNEFVESIFNKFRRLSFEELEEKYGYEEAVVKVRKVDIAKYVAGFLSLEFIILGWATISYFFFGGNMTGLAWFGYVLDDLGLGAIVFILEGVYALVDGTVESSNVYALKPIEIPFMEKSTIKATTVQEVNKKD